MKRSFNYLLALISILVLGSCQKEYALYEEVTAPSGLAAPENNYFVKIVPSGTATLEISWQKASAKDGGLVLYEVLFDDEQGDFSEPAFSILSDNKGTATRATLDHKTLNKIAAAAGIEALATGKVKWTVVATKGANEAKASESRTLELERPLGFAEIPAELYLAGSATEGGAIPLRLAEEGVFEVYTALKAGTYHLQTAADASGKQYFIENGVIREGSGETTVGAAEDGVYRLTFDFGSATVKAVKIEKIELFMAAYNMSIGELSYAGGSSWKGENIHVEFYPFSWGRDERYKFRLVTSEGNEYLGSANANNNSPVGAPAAYFYLYPVNDSQWEYTYKFDPAADMKDVTAEVFLKGDAPYSHKITVQ